MRNYWSCTPFADWVRGSSKLKMGTGEQWHEWETKAREAHPVRWWIAEEGLDRIQDVFLYIPNKLYDIKYYINNRFITRTHALTASARDIPRGQWRDVGNRFLPCLFNELVNYVEVELAWWHLAWESKENRAKYNAPWWRFGWWNVRAWRCPQAGLDNLKWQSELVWKEDECEPGSANIGKPTHQAKAAKEILELYKWWTEVYPNRPDPMDASGWTEYCNRMREESGEGLRWIGIQSKNKETEALGRRALKLSRKIEQQYAKEDEAMMIRLIKIRESLWT